MTFVETGLKPLSANQSYLGKKVKSKAYRLYENHMRRNLPELDLPSEGNLLLTLEVHYSNKASDIDNCLKPFIDCLQQRYDFNDNRIYDLHIVKYIVPKGEETIRFCIEAYPHDNDLRKK